MAALALGEESGATKFLDKKIVEQGEGERAIAAESQMLYLLSELHKREAPNAHALAESVIANAREQAAKIIAANTTAETPAARTGDTPCQ